MKTYQTALTFHNLWLLIICFESFPNSTPMASLLTKAFLNITHAFKLRDVLELMGFPSEKHE